MKKLAIILLLVATLALSVAGIASAQTVESQICDMAKQNEKVLDAQCVIYQRACLVAVKTEKFTTRSEYDDYVDNLTQSITDKFEIDNVVVTRNPKIMAKICKLANMTEDARNEIIEDMIEHALTQRPHKPTVIPRVIW